MKLKARHWTALAALALTLTIAAAVVVRRTSGSALLARDEAIALAVDRATRLGYPAESMEIEASRKGRDLVVTFLPPVGQLGGDLTVTVDLTTGEVAKVVRGQ